MMVLENPGWSATSVRDFHLKNTETEVAKVALLRHTFFYWFNDLLSKLVETSNEESPVKKPFEKETFFQVMERTLKNVESLRGKVNPESIYITDICKACNFVLQDTDKSI